MHRAFTTPNESQHVTITGEWQALGITETVPADTTFLPVCDRLLSRSTVFIWRRHEYASFKLTFQFKSKTKLDHYHDQQESAGSCLPYTTLLLVRGSWRASAFKLRFDSMRPILSRRSETHAHITGLSNGESFIYIFISCWMMMPPAEIFIALPKDVYPILPSEKFYNGGRHGGPISASDRLQEKLCVIWSKSDFIHLNNCILW